MFKTVFKTAFYYFKIFYFENLLCLIDFEQEFSTWNHEYEISLQLLPVNVKKEAFQESII